MASTSETIFLDTAFFKALVDLKDDFHTLAVETWTTIEEEKTGLVTSNFVLDESFTLIRVKCGLGAALEFRERLGSGLKRMKIFRVTVADEAKAWEWFKKEWRDLSFTDCVSFALMKRLGIEKVATFDDHFEKAGFEVVK